MSENVARLASLLLCTAAACGPAPDVGDVQEAGGMIADARGVFVTGARPATPTQGGLYLMQLDTSAAERIAGGDGTLHVAGRLVADDVALYFAGSSGGAWGIYRLSRAEGSAPEKLAAAEAEPTALTTDGQGVFWASVKAGATTGDVLRVPSTGGATTTVLAGVLAPRGLAVDVDSVYFTDQDPKKVMWQRGEVRKGALAGGGSTTTVLAEGLVEPGELAVVSDAVIVVDAGSPTSGCSSTGGAVLRVPFAGGKPVQLGYDLQGVGGLVVTAGNAWYRTGFACGKPPENSSVWRAATSGAGHATPLAQGLVGPRGLAVDAQYVYWTIIGTGTTDHAVLRRAAR